MQLREICGHSQFAVPEPTPTISSTAHSSENTTIIVGEMSTFAPERLTVDSEDPGTVTAFGQTAGVTPLQGRMSSPESDAKASGPNRTAS